MDKTKRFDFNWKLHLIYASVFVLMFLFFTMLNFLIVHLGDEIQNLNYAGAMQKHIKSNNMSYPFYAIEDTNALNNLRGSKINDYYFNRDMVSFHELLTKHYYYEKDTYNCVYYSYVWSSYIAYNKDKLNLNFKYITTDNHVYVQAYNESGYCILDGLKMDCSFIN